MTDLTPAPTTPWYISKRVWLNVAMIVGIIIPKTNAFIQQYFSETATTWATLNIILGFISKGKISIS